MIQKCRDQLPEHHWELIYVGIAKDVEDQQEAVSKLLETVLQWCDQVSKFQLTMKKVPPFVAGEN